MSKVIQKPKTWQISDLYQEYARSLLAANPGVIEKVPYQARRGKGRHGEQRYETKYRSKLIGGYWGKLNRSKNIKNYWIYTLIRQPGGQQKVIEVINYDRWKKMLEAYFLSARDSIVMGYTLNLGNKLGYIEPRHIERNHANRKINFGETKKQPRVVVDETTGKTKPERIIYYTDDTYIRIAWRKIRQLPGERSYEFIPCHGDSRTEQGFDQQFSQANIANPALKHTYPWYPYIMQRDQKAS